MEVAKCMICGMNTNPNINVVFCHNEYNEGNNKNNCDKMKNNCCHNDFNENNNENNCDKMRNNCCNRALFEEFRKQDTVS